MGWGCRSRRVTLPPGNQRGNTLGKGNQKQQWSGDDLSKMIVVLSFDVFSLLMVLAGQHETLDFCYYFYMYEVSI